LPHALPDFHEIDCHLFEGWPPMRVENVHGWRCAIDGGVTRRPNSVWPIAWDGVASLDAAIDEVEAVYRATNLRACFRISDAAVPRSLDARLAERGYEIEGRSHVLAAPLHEVSARAPDRAEMALLSAPSAGWLACYGSGLARESDVPIVRSIFGRIGHTHVFAAAIRDGVAASVMLAVHTGPWVQISAVRTLPAHRRQGLAAGVMTAAAAWAHRQGARGLVLSVEAANAPAVSLYGAAGLKRIYGYHYRAKA
jgi:N-acetylglutamate synthase